MSNVSFKTSSFANTTTTTATMWPFHLICVVFAIYGVQAEYFSDYPSFNPVISDVVYLDRNNEPMCEKGGIPVCGMNEYGSMIFENECRLDAYNMRAIFSEQSDFEKTLLSNCYDTCELACPRIYEPVCVAPVATGVPETVSNQCELSRRICISNEEWTFIKTGACDEPIIEPIPPTEKPACPAVCRMENAPICATLNNNQRTFSSVCALRQRVCRTNEAWTVKHNGQCVSTSFRPPLPYPFYYAPQYNNQRTYNNYYGHGTQTSNVQTQMGSGATSAGASSASGPYRRPINRGPHGPSPYDPMPYGPAPYGGIPYGLSSYGPAVSNRKPYYPWYDTPNRQYPGHRRRTSTTTTTPVPNCPPVTTTSTTSTTTTTTTETPITTTTETPITTTTETPITTTEELTTTTEESTTTTEESTTEESTTTTEESTTTTEESTTTTEESTTTTEESTTTTEESTTTTEESTTTTEESTTTTEEPTTTTEESTTTTEESTTTTEESTTTTEESTTTTEESTTTTEESTTTTEESTTTTEESTTTTEESTTTTEESTTTTEESTTTEEATTTTEEATTTTEESTTTTEESTTTTEESTTTTEESTTTTEESTTTTEESTTTTEESTTTTEEASTTTEESTTTTEESTTTTEESTTTTEESTTTTEEPTTTTTEEPTTTTTEEPTTSTSPVPTPSAPPTPCGPVIPTTERYPQNSGWNHGWLNPQRFPNVYNQYGGNAYIYPITTNNRPKQSGGYDQPIHTWPILGAPNYPMYSPGPVSQSIFSPVPYHYSYSPYWNPFPGAQRPPQPPQIAQGPVQFTTDTVDTYVRSMVKSIMHGNKQPYNLRQ